MNEKRDDIGLILPVTPEFIERRIYIVRGHKVMLDSDLAELYQVETKQLNRSVRRNISRFPADFMFRLRSEEVKNLRCQIGTSRSYGGRRYAPYAFTELGVAMLSSVLKSERAVQMNIFIMRAFVKLRELLATNIELKKKIDDLEKVQGEHAQSLIVISEAIRKLIDAQKPKHDAIGFVAE